MDTVDMIIYRPEDYESTKGHSVLRNKWGYGGRALSPIDDLYLTDVYRPKYTTYFDTTGTENEIRRNVNRELLFSTHAADDAFDVAAKSKNRDQEILREASNAIPPSKSTPAAYDTSAGRKVSSAYVPHRRFQTEWPDSDSYRSVLTLKPSGARSQSDWASSSIYRDIRNPERYELRRRAARESPIRSPTISPYQSPRESPDRELGQGRRYRRVAPGRVGSSYTRLINKNSYDVDDYSDIDDTFDDEDDRDKYLNYPIRCDDMYDDGDDIIDDGQSTTSHISSYYVPPRERSPSPVEYMAYQPRKRRVYDDDEKSETPPRYTSVADIPLFSMPPYRSALNINKSALVQSNSPVRHGSSVANDVMFHDIISQTAAKARQALKNVNLDEYDSAALVFSVEGEMKDPVRGKAVGFEYVARPLMLKGPMLAGPASYAIRSSDHDFRGYLNDLSNFRQGIKDRLSSGYSALSEAVRLPRYRRRLPLAIDYEDDEDIYDYGYTSSLLSRRKRIGDYLYGERLNLFPTVGSRHRALTSSDASLDQIDTMEMYDPDAELQLTTLEKIKIKAALVGSKVDVVTPKSRKPKSEYAAKAIRRIKKEEREQTVPEDVTCSSMSASKPVSTTSTRGGKAIRDVDGFSQPKNVLSWQYRIESRMDPEDYIEVPKTYAAVKERMKHIHCKMDKHRQLMDRYLEPDLKPESEDVKSKIMNLYVDLEQRNPSGSGEGATSSSTEYSEKTTSVRASSVRPPPVSFVPGTKFHGDDNKYSPMSDVRRRVRSVIRKNKRAASVL
ncbi:uncharacterized protein LOC132565152 isoform X2 [Ylistrum balloti]|uniref:uncharacterized protein LOC132565152 isoform X2 n=1 Tax=Ylistrum balloti TaxID=509963 RepID=UPI002905C2E2|nr:uncharacterized protein LOC132565152 isoform X2 [Ylistrum balloti]